jgi:hypothetical protein
MQVLDRCQCKLWTATAAANAIASGVVLRLLLLQVLACLQLLTVQAANACGGLLQLLWMKAGNASAELLQLLPTQAANACGGLLQLLQMQKLDSCQCKC